MNVALVEGMAEGSGVDPQRVSSASADGRCCVRIRADGDAEPADRVSRSGGA
jgi:hypothetical protein